MDWDRGRRDGEIGRIAGLLVKDDRRSDLGQVEWERRERKVYRVQTPPHVGRRWWWAGHRRQRVVFSALGGGQRERGGGGVGRACMGERGGMERGE